MACGKLPTMASPDAANGDVEKGGLLPSYKNTYSVVIYYS